MRKMLDEIFLKHKKRKLSCSPPPEKKRKKLTGVVAGPLDATRHPAEEEPGPVANVDEFRPEEEESITGGENAPDGPTSTKELQRRAKAEAVNEQAAREAEQQLADLRKRGIIK